MQQQQSIDTSKLSGKTVDSLKSVATPNLDDHLIAPEDFAAKGELSPVAARIVLKALYLARMNRPDAIWTVNYLARHVTRWSAACDKRLRRLVAYLHHNSDCVLVTNSINLDS